MGFSSSRPGYTVRVDGLLLGSTRFVIQAAIEYEAWLTDGERERLVPIAQLEALLAIEGEEARGRRLGARDVHVGVVGDEPLYRLFRTRTPAAQGRVTDAGPRRGYPTRGLSSSMHGRVGEAVS